VLIANHSGNRSQNQNGSRKTRPPTENRTSSLKFGPAKAKVWNPPFVEGARRAPLPLRADHEPDGSVYVAAALRPPDECQPIAEVRRVARAAEPGRDDFVAPVVDEADFPVFDKGVAIFGRLGRGVNGREE
jgi:hypothetical protein